MDLRCKHPLIRRRWQDRRFIPKYRPVKAFTPTNGSAKASPSPAATCPSSFSLVVVVIIRNLHQTEKSVNYLIDPIFFIFGLDEPWAHRDQCLRITFSQSPEIVQQGLEIIADEVIALTEGR